MSQIHKIRSCFSPRIFFGRLEMSELPALKWLIFGCGGVGGYFGARIAQVKGQRVSYIATWLAASDSVTQTFFLVDLNLENRFILRFPSRTMMHLGYRTLPIDETGPALDISMMYDASINVLQIKLKQSIFETLRPSHT